MTPHAALCSALVGTLLVPSLGSAQGGMSNAQFIKPALLGVGSKTGGCRFESCRACSNVKRRSELRHDQLLTRRIDFRQCRRQCRIRTLTLPCSPSQPLPVQRSLRNALMEKPPSRTIPPIV